MEMTRSRRPDRHRSPYASRSRSRSLKARRTRRSTSRERHRYALSPKRRTERISYGDHFRDHSISPVRLSPPHTRHFESVTVKSDGRLKKPEIQPSAVYAVADNQTEPNQLSSTLINPLPITLTERFTRLTTSGTTLYNSRQFIGGRPRGDAKHLPHLILTNNMQLPPATLVRQAKAISVVVERKFPSGKTRPVVDESRGSESVRIPRRSSEGLRPVFDRPEVKLYQSPTDEWQISKRLLECITSSSRSKPADSSHRGDASQYHDLAVVGPGRFYGSRVDESSANPRFARPLDPMETPRNPAYFMHDTRDDTNLTSRRNWRTRFPNTAAGYRREFRDRRSPGSPERSLVPHPESPVDVSDRWAHDKFEQLEREDGVRPVEPGKSVPKPVPAPKPILWSTIGKEIVNGEPQATKATRTHVSDHSPSVECSSVSPIEKVSVSNSVMGTADEKFDPTTHTSDDVEDVRIDVEPMLADES